MHILFVTFFNLFVFVGPVLLSLLVLTSDYRD